MEKSDTPGGAALGAMTDTLDFVKKMWGNLGVPGMVVPTLSIDEINKKIADLKAVESWLSLNMNMLRGTIQALEIQSGTIAALQSMSAAIGMPGTANGEPAPPPFESPFTASASAPAAEKNDTAPSPSGSARPPFEFHHPAPAADTPQDQATPSEPGPGAAANPAAWWNLLQEQFQQAVSNAVGGPSALGTPPAKSKPGAGSPAAAKGKSAMPAAGRKRKPS